MVGLSRIFISRHPSGRKSRFFFFFDIKTWNKFRIPSGLPDVTLILRTWDLTCVTSCVTGPSGALGMPQQGVHSTGLQGAQPHSGDRHRELQYGCCESRLLSLPK